MTTNDNPCAAASPTVGVTASARVPPGAPATLGTAPPASASAPSPAGTKACPDCAEEIEAAAGIGRHGGHRFGDPV